MRNKPACLRVSMNHTCVKDVTTSDEATRVPGVRDDDYYGQVARYYDHESKNFQQNYESNQILQRIRKDFRAVTEHYQFGSALEIGSGPGIDLVYFASKYPERWVCGIDVSPEMVDLSKKNLGYAEVQNAHVALGSPEGIPELFPNQRFDLIYCYYGALNTVKDLSEAARTLRAAVSENGTMVLTFINRWYLFDILWNILRLRFRKAISRINNTWLGYSPAKPLPSTCRSAREIKSLFCPHFKIVRKKGYSLVFPAWYRSKFIPTNGPLGDFLWAFDQLLNKTPFWNLGEYTLYVLRPR